MPDIPAMPLILSGLPKAANQNALRSRSLNEDPSARAADQGGISEARILGLPPDAVPESHLQTADKITPFGLFQDIPGAIWKVFLSAWSAFFALLWLFFAAGAASTFFVTISVLFGAMAFGLPIIIARQCPNAARRLPNMIETHTGPVSTKAAGAQIALIPVAVVIGLLGFILFAK